MGSCLAHLLLNRKPNLLLTMSSRLAHPASLRRIRQSLLSRLGHQLRLALLLLHLLRTGCAWRRAPHVGVGWMPTVEVLNRNRYRNCRCLARLGLRLVRIQERLLDQLCLPHSGQLLPVLHLDSRTKRRVRVRVEVLLLMRTQNHLRAQVGVTHLAPRNLQRIQRLQGLRLVSLRQKVGLRPPVVSHSTSLVQRRRTRRLLGFPSRPQSLSNTPRVLHSARQRLNQHARPLRAGLRLDKLKPRHRPPLLLSRLVHL